MPDADASAARAQAIALLARREHSRKELRSKLNTRGYEAGLLEALLDTLAAEGLQNDRRFTENYLHSRLQKGYGPQRLVQELRERGIDEQLIQSALDGLDVDWMEMLRSVRLKKFGRSWPSGFNAQARESRFLQYRGFDTDQIRNLYKNHTNDEQ